MSTFAHALRQTMNGKVGAQKLSTLTGIPTGTIESWMHPQMSLSRKATIVRPPPIHLALLWSTPRQ